MSITAITAFLLEARKMATGPLRIDCKGNTMLFDHLDRPDFAGMTAWQAWDACDAWEEWAFDNAESFSEEKWEEIVRIMCDNRDRYYAKYGG